MPLDATLTRDAAPHRGLRRALVGLVSLSLAFAGSLSLAGAAHATSPLGDTAASWPTTMSSYRYATGAIVQDPTGDIGLTTSDLTSGVCSGSSCTGGLSTSDFVSDGTNVFFRERIATDITDASKGGLGGNFFLVDIAVNGVIKAAVGVNGKSTTTDYVYATDANNTAATTYEVYDFPWTGGAAGARVIPDGSGQYFLDWQIPMKYITLASGGAITATTAVQLYYGSSAAANLAVINKDYFTGTGTTVDFTGLSTVSFGPTSATLTSGTPTTVPSGATLVSGTATTYDVALTAANPSGNDISGATVTTILPANVTLSSPPAGVTVSGSTVTWTIGSLLGGASASKTLRLTITPTQAQVGSTAKLLNTQAFSGADVAFGGTVTATGAAVNTPTVVAQGNRAPVANADSVTTNEDTAGTVNVLTNDTDADGNTLTATILTQPTHGTASVSGGVATYTPSANYNGADSFTYKACDPSSACSTATVSVTVTAVNDAPVATAYSNVTSKNVALVSTVTGTDVDGDTLTFAKASNPAHGTVVVAGNGGFTYTPTTDYMGSDSFTFTACDPSSACSTGTASITVTPTNVAPVAAADSLTTNEDTAGTVNVLTNDTDGDGDAMTVGSLTQPAHGAVTESGGVVTYTPAANYNGADSFTYKACDIYSACSAVTTVSVTVTAVNDVPTTTAYSGSTDKNVTLADTLTGADVDGDTLTFTKVADPAHGTVTVNANGTFSYVPTHNYAGPDSFTFKACDPSAACTATTTASITINPTNVAPTTAADSFTTNEDTATVLDVLANDTDADGDAMTVTVATQPTHGTTSSAGGLLTYTPDANYNGPDTFTYQACDPSSACSAATAVAITVTAVNDSPVATAYSGSTDTATPLAGTLTGTDVDGDPLTFQASGTPAHGAVVINADGTFTYTPSGTFVGTDTFSFQACDSSVCTTGTASITVTQGNRAPTGATSPSVDTDQDQPVSGAVSASDPDSDPLTYAVTSSTIGTLTFNADGT
ncbi:MAG: large repetitive protein, partial [Frankiaceae bacterium]|nr:large repetitive protein [Frankiaceae bacterium]